MSEITMACFGAWILLSLCLAWYMWTMPEQAEVGCMIRDSDTGGAWAELSEAVMGLVYTMMAPILDLARDYPRCVVVGYGIMIGIIAYTEVFR